MKFTPEVIAALQVLRDNAVNDFERHRIDVLERDLTAPPTVEIIDDHHQRFNGIVYNRDKTNHFRATYHIHRAVWEYYNGSIPIKHEIHHIDENPKNNCAQNLQCLTKSEHQKIHKPQGQPATQRTKNLLIHCAFCGQLFKASESHRRYCSEKCRLANEIITKVCPVCGKIFPVQKKHKHQVFCSIHCFMVDRYSKKINASTAVTSPA